MCLEVRVEPGQLIGVCGRKAVHQVVTVAEVRKSLHWVLCSGVMASELVFQHAIHTQTILGIARVEGAEVWVCDRGQAVRFCFNRRSS